ncbi:MAG: hypothetical protein A7315_07010 [Candidatus Altiarchaeales archaeon WOR_SM1_79]|nr:MAG: hypothetical protein A7315_07010 [Candidatus Altiarchaeales archaeon WOR_SM1_79]
MIIRGGYFKEGGFYHPFVSAEISFPELNTTDYIWFLVDTGADRTAISEKDVSRLRIGYDKLKKTNKDLCGIGGSVETYETEAIIKLSAEHIDRINILVMKNKIPDEIPQKEKERLRVLYQGIPSLLGRDILDEFGIFIHRKTNRILVLSDEKIPEDMFHI